MSSSLNIEKPFAAPVVDSLAVRVVVDSRYERFLRKADHSSVAIEHVGGIGAIIGLRYLAEMFGVNWIGD
jgi:hypothetical protein